MLKAVYDRVGRTLDFGRCRNVPVLLNLRFLHTLLWNTRCRSNRFLVLLFLSNACVIAGSMILICACDLYPSCRYSIQIVFSSQTLMQEDLPSQPCLGTLHAARKRENVTRRPKEKDDASVCLCAGGSYVREAQSRRSSYLGEPQVVGIASTWKEAVRLQEMLSKEAGRRTRQEQETRKYTSI